MTAASGTRVLVLAGVASLAMAFGAQAQTADQCKAAVADANAAIDAAGTANEPSKNEAQQLSLSASNAGDQGNFAECVDLAAQAKAAIASK